MLQKTFTGVPESIKLNKLWNATYNIKQTILGDKLVTTELLLGAACLLTLLTSPWDTLGPADSTL